MWIKPIRGTEIAGTHAPAGIAVDAPDGHARELLSFGLAERTEAPAPVPAPAPVEPPATVIETAEAPPAPENAALPRARRRR